MVASFLHSVDTALGFAMPYPSSHPRCLTSGLWGQGGGLWLQASRALYNLSRKGELSEMGKGN